ncbi:hypothetical protein H5410_019669 [Solanum commersonii]|uniref:Uncharacterized protein n=1 Tax=Solanum commersonii TaxID=4109 RepID=A0A9J5ZA75_SOLCO|nr:hypothetical protein H5410_019669 [Solanum commersonii]
MLVRHHREVQEQGLDGFEYFTSLETMKTNNSHTMVVTATPRGNLAFVFFREFSQIGSNFGEFEHSMDSPTSINVNALMDDLTDMDEKFAMMDEVKISKGETIWLAYIRPTKDMITNTIRAQYGGTRQSSLY